ncbi:AMP-binding protein [Paraburkholderia sp. GAS348]|uniref:AMP-binding protein n=1 Tax=Paraburkholderia sp. GAS348 TaxID=3035132 RepID=UPI003D244843
MTTVVEAQYQGIFQPQLLVHALSYNLDRPFLHYGDDQIMTAGDYRDLVSQYLQSLRVLGLARGARIGVLSANRPEVLAVTGACLLGEYVLVPMHPLASLEDHQYAICDSGMEALIFDPESYNERGTALAGATDGLLALSIGPATTGRNLCELVGKMEPEALVAPDTSPEDVYRLSYSGGTTGKPKAVAGTHRVGAAMLSILMAEWEWPAEVKQLMCAHLSHAGSAMFLPTLLRGGAMVIMRGFDPLKVLQAIEKHRITCVLLVPTMIYALLDHPRATEFDLSSLETVFYGAAAMSPTRLRQGLARLGPVFFQWYGQVEAPMTVCVMRRADHVSDDPERLASCGRPVPWVHVELLDEQMRRVPDGVAGEICVRGPLVMARYHNRPEQTADALAGGWLHTGDVAVRDKGGFLRIVDRKKDMIVSGGFNVYPREVEDVLSGHPSVASCAVVGLPDPYWGEVVTAFVVLRTDEKHCTESLQALVREKKGPAQVPKVIEFVDELPLTAVGKIDKKSLRANYKLCSDRTVTQ